LQIDQASINRAQLTELGTNSVQQDTVLGVGTTPGILGTGDGFYRVLFIDWNGDNRGTPWYADITCVGVTGVAPFGVQNQDFSGGGSQAAPSPATQIVP
jgi:hypothetical protein